MLADWFQCRQDKIYGSYLDKFATRHRPLVARIALCLDEVCGEYQFFRIIDITQEKGLCSESVTECEKQVCR